MAVLAQGADNRDGEGLHWKHRDTSLEVRHSTSARRSFSRLRLAQILNHDSANVPYPFEGGLAFPHACARFLPRPPSGETMIRGCAHDDSARRKEKMRGIVHLSQAFSSV